MSTLKTVMNKVLAAACALLLAFMSFIAVYQVVARYVFMKPSTMSEDILSYSFVWLSLLAAALVFGEREHMRLGFFADRASRTTRLFLGIVSELLVIAVAVVVFLFGGKGFMAVGAMQMSPTLGITMDWAYAILPLSGVLIVLYGSINIVEMVRMNDVVVKGGVE